MKIATLLWIAFACALTSGCAASKHIKQGDLFVQQGRPGQAVAEYKAALASKESLSQDPVFIRKLAGAETNALCEDADTFISRNEWVDAAARYQQALKTNKDCMSAAEGLARARKDGAKWHYQQAMDCANKAELNDAIRHLRVSLELDPQNQDAQDALSNLEQTKTQLLRRANDQYGLALGHAKDKDWQKTADTLAKAIKIDKNHFLARAKLCEAARQMAKAREQLRSLREVSSLTLRAVEDRTGVSNPYLSQLESGKIRQPSPVVLHKLAELYGVPYQTLMEKAGYPVPESAKTDASAGLFQRFGRLSQDEEQSLLEYLSFLRSRSSRGRGKR